MPGDNQLEGVLNDINSKKVAVETIIKEFAEQVKKLEDLKADAEQKSRDADERAAAAEQKEKEAREKSEEAIKNLSRAEELVKENYAPIISAIFEKPQEQLSNEIRRAGDDGVRKSLYYSIVVTIVSIIGTTVYSNIQSNEVNDIVIPKIKKIADDMASTKQDFLKIKTEVEVVSKNLANVAKTPNADQKIAALSLEVEAFTEVKARDGTEESVVNDIVNEVSSFKKDKGKISNANDVAIFYKMRLSSSKYSSVKYKSVAKGLLKAGVSPSIMPLTDLDYLEWDIDILYITKEMLRKAFDKRDSKEAPPAGVRSFKENRRPEDNTNYGGWEWPYETYSEFYSGMKSGAGSVLARMKFNGKA